MLLFKWYIRNKCRNSFLWIAIDAETWLYLYYTLLVFNHPVIKLQWNSWKTENTVKNFYDTSHTNSNLAEKNHTNNWKMTKLNKGKKYMKYYRTRNTTQNKKSPLFRAFATADDRNRTCTSWTPDPKSGASASSATSAGWIKKRSHPAACQWACGDSNPGQLD